MKSNKGRKKCNNERKKAQKYWDLQSIIQRETETINTHLLREGGKEIEFSKKSSEYRYLEEG